jgi:hypothetical protein
MRSKVNSKKLVVVSATLLSLTSLFGSFAGSLNRYKIYSQKANTLFGEKESLILISEFDTETPFGYDSTKAQLKFEKLDSQLNIKIGLLSIAIVIPALTLSFGASFLEDLDIDDEVADISNRGKKELKLAQVKQKFALASKAQQQLFLDELQSLVELSGHRDIQELKVTESLESKFTQAANLIMDGYDKDTAVAITWECDRGSEEHKQFMQKFDEWQQSEIL